MKPQNDNGQAGKDATLVLETLEKFRAGWEQLDAQQVLSTIAERDDVFIYGTDLEERWVGYKAFAGPVREMVNQFENPQYFWGKDEPVISVEENFAWASGDLTVTLTVDGQPQTDTMRSTFVLTCIGKAWKIVQAHFSIGQVDPVVDY